MSSIRQVTLCQFEREDGFLVEVRSQDSAALHRTDPSGASAESWEAAYRWMRENGYARGPYRVEARPPAVAPDHSK
jgi:hypothetical protein